jgi:hypothetical protein
VFGYKAVSNRNANKDITQTSNAASQQVQTIKSSADLNKAESTLNSENVDGDLNPASMNQDVNSLL